MRSLDGAKFGSTKNLRSKHLKLLTFTRGKTKGIVEKANREGIERNREALRAIVKYVDSVKTHIE